MGWQAARMGRMLMAAIVATLAVAAPPAAALVAVRGGSSYADPIQIDFSTTTVATVTVGLDPTDSAGNTVRISSDDTLNLVGGSSFGCSTDGSYIRCLWRDPASPSTRRLKVVFQCACSSNKAGIDHIVARGQLNGDPASLALPLPIETYVGNQAEVTGSDYGDNLVGSLEGDEIDGGPGNDIVSGGDGDDTLDGGDGTDDVHGGNDNDPLVDGGAGDESGASFPNDSGITLTPRVHGGSGNDIVQGGSGNDDIDGGPGMDALRGGIGADLIAGGSEQDTLAYDEPDRTGGVTVSMGAGSGNDGGPEDISGLLRDTVGADVEDLTGTDFADTIVGTDGPNTLVGDRTLGGTGADRIEGRGENDALFGLGGNDTLLGEDGVDQVNGGDADDILRGGLESDQILGGDGNDTASYEDALSEVTASIAGGGGTTGESDTLVAIENLTGSPFADMLTGDAGANRLDGGDGVDILTGNNGPDDLRGGPGADDIRAQDGEVDNVDCGPAADKASIDDVDVVSNCEDKAVFDKDGDGAAPPQDCNDNNAAIRPGATDVPGNGVDEDCSGSDAVVPDADGDGIETAQDCNDADATIRPGALEIPGNAVDENCDGVVAPFPRLDVDVLSATHTFPGFTRFTRLVVVRVPAGASVRVSCKSDRTRGCGSLKSKRITARTAGTVSLTSLFKKPKLRPDAVVTIQVTAPGLIGKVVTYTIRKGGKTPTRSVVCIYPGDKQAAC